MNKDNLLFAVVGILLGFVAAYLFFEAMATRQPARLGAGGPAATTAGPMGQQTAPQGNPQAGGGAGMAQVQELQNRLQQNPNDSDAIRELANLNVEIQNWARARELYDRYLELKPGDPDIMTRLGVVHLQMGDFQVALPIFQQVHRISPTHWESYFYEVISLGSLNRWDEANKVLAKLEELQPNNPDVQRLAADVRLRNGGAPPDPS